MTVKYAAVLGDRRLVTAREAWRRGGVRVEPYL